MGDAGHLLGQVRHLRKRVDGRLHLVGLNQHVGHAVLVVLLIQLVGGALHAQQEGNGGVFDRLAVGAGDRLHPGDAGDAEDGLGDLVDHQEVSRIPQIVIAFDHHQLGVHPGGVEVSIGDGITDIGRRVVGHEVASVVVGLVAR